ncbi:hypothetical protein BA171_06950 [Candidatus Hamiltonella defensa (Bemisia tabaci)]|uniref:Pilus assembly protein n=2 Tax=Candidatus Williamhamiltonella defendens TaxID=138072 RepID=A0A249E0T1_9ENTR|nr:hypothetical protein BA171_06950 [Candidatus Hamiltonella defensa (Bemisia tabaci)]
MMGRFKKVLMMTLSGFCFFGQTLFVSATAGISIGAMYDVLNSETQSMSKRIYNSGDSTAFVRVELLQIHPGDKNTSQEIPLKEVTGNVLEKNRLIVTPLRLIIPPGGFQAVRILWPGDRTTERYFRIRFIPVAPKADDDFGLDKKALEKHSQEMKAGVNILAGYGSILIVQPDKPVFNSVINADSPKVITIQNNGNTTISLNKIRECKNANTGCGPYSRRFVLPGRTYSMNKKSGYQTNFTLIEGNNQRKFSD